jgi:hypothetical protein
MKIIQLLFLSATLVFKPIFAWDCSRECDDYEQCVKEQNRNRELGIFEPHAVDQDDKETDAAAHAISIPPLSNLRGNIMYQNNTSRSLQSSFHFQVKMYWERHYCWQAETRERKWCWECRGSCTSDAIVEIDYCDSGDKDQQWVYTNAGDGKVRISPESDRGLCMENGDGVMKLKSCDESDSKQKLSGFQSGGSKFELFVGGDSSKLISQGHDPKSHEKLQLVKKDTARGDHTNFWQVINPSSSSSSGGQSSSAVSKNSKPPIDFRGSNYCTHGNPCSLCQGDCDDDESCEGQLICRKRSAFESFDGCSGGGSDGSESDYCVWP